MNFNSFVFSAPQSSYDKETFQEELIWVPRKKKMASEPQNVKVRAASQDKAIIKRSSVRKFSRVYKISHEDANIVDTQEISTRIQACMQSLEFTEKEQREEFDLHDISFSKPSPYSRGASPKANSGKCLDVQAVQTKLIEEDLNSKDICVSGLNPIKKHHHSLENVKGCPELKTKKTSKSIGCFSFLGRRKSTKGISAENDQSRNSSRLLKRSSITEMSISTSKRSHFAETITYIRATQTGGTQNNYGAEAVQQGGIPCLFLKNKPPTAKYLIYFHANSEDICLAYDLLDHLKQKLKVNVIAGEYPGYGVYRGTPSEKKIIADAESIYEFVLENFKAKEEDIILLGRSIGSGPAVHLASRHNPGALILMSSFTSVRDIAKDRIGVVGQYLIKNRFKNLQNIPSVNSPTLVIHGQKDEVISHTHAKKLFDACRSKKKIEIRQEMSHNQFDFHDDMSIPISDFLNETIRENTPEKESNSINTLTKLQAAN